uniref:Embryo sac development arrest 6 n=1 Tax=Opuntia streptacantha TaxID=393608 RepID=A0A7C9D967_OPUST
MIHTSRKDREDSPFYNIKGSFGKPQQLKQPPSTNHNTTPSSSPPVEPACPPPVQSNRILAGYMAYEFLTRGTLFGQRFDPARAEAVPLAAAEPKRKPCQTGPEPKRPKVEPNRSYTEVAQLLMGDGAHIPGIVNPTQLSRWIQM